MIISAVARKKQPGLSESNSVKAGFGRRDVSEKETCTLVDPQTRKLGCESTSLNTKMNLWNMT